MPTVEQNLSLWGKPEGWSDDGDRWSANWGGTDVEWWASLFPRVRKYLPASTILEIAPGFGRWAQFLKGFCQQFIAVDLSPACIARLQERFKSDPHVHCYVNDGKSLGMVEDRSVDFAFSYDSLPHVEADVIGAYLQELGRKLKPGGFAFIHHSNLESYRKSLWIPKAIVRPQPMKANSGQNGHVPRSLWLRRSLKTKLTNWGLVVNTFNNRAESVSARIFLELCDAAGLDCVSQELVNWNFGPWLTDCLSIVTPRHGQARRPPRLLKNPHFMAEAERLRRIAEFYSGGS
jgi:SAM-dependent methyltransferase